MAEETVVTQEMYDNLVTSLTQKANAGDSTSMKLLGDLLYQGFDKQQRNIDAAFPWWKMAADHGEDSVAGKVGVYICENNENAAEASKAIPYLKTAANAGDMFASWILGFGYETGRFGKPDLNQAERYYRMAALAGSAEAQGRLAYLCSLKKNVDEMYDWLIAASLNGDKKLKELFNDFYRDGSADLRRDFDARIRAIQLNGNLPPRAGSFGSKGRTVDTNQPHTSRQEKVTTVLRSEENSFRSGVKIKNNNTERIRDAMAGAVLGAVLAIIIFLLSIINSVIHTVGGFFSGESSFETMQGSTLTVLIVVLMLIGAGLGFALGCYVTQESTIKKKVQKWMLRHNH